MAKFVIEKTYLLPVYKHEEIEADTLEQACEKAVESDDWEGQEEDYESSRATYITGAWQGDDAFPQPYGENGDDFGIDVPQQFQFDNARHS